MYVLSWDIRVTFLIVKFLGEDEERFLRFMVPIEETFQSLEQIVSSGTGRSVELAAQTSPVKVSLTFLDKVLTIDIS